MSIYVEVQWGDKKPTVVSLDPAGEDPIATAKRWLKQHMPSMPDRMAVISEEQAMKILEENTIRD